MSEQPTRLCFLGLLVLVAGLVAVPLRAAAQDDHFVVVDDQTLHIPKQQLLANDGGHGTIVVVSGPSLGQLAEYATYFEYTAPGGLDELLAEDQFTYSLAERTLTETFAVVTLRLLPRRLPVGGRFFDPGTTELGFFDAHLRYFALCRQGLAAESCRRYFPPPGSTGVLPAVGDWDGDQLDELALYDPASRQVEFFDLVADNRLLQALGSRDSGEHHGAPAAGPSAEGRVALWSRNKGSFTLLGLDAEPMSWAPPELAPDSETSDLVPVQRPGQDSASQVGLCSFGFARIDWFYPGTQAPAQYQALSVHDGAFLIRLVFDGVEHFGFFDPAEKRYQVAAAVPIQSIPIPVNILDEPDCDPDPGETCEHGDDKSG